MQKKVLCIFLICCGVLSSYGQQCPLLTNPLNGSNNVPVSTTISWTAVEGVPGYLISIGTTPNGIDIVNNQAVGSATNFTPPFGLPENTQIYVTLTLFFFNQPNISCTSESFSTEDVIAPPPCTTLTNPINNATNVNIATNINWNASPTATGYRIAIGTTSGGTEILPSTDIGNTLSYNPPADLDTDTQFFVRIIPYNENGDLSPCPEETFTTGPAVILPNCTNLESPLNGAIDVPLTPFLEWTAITGATGYRVSIGTSPFVNDILEEVVFFTNTTFVLNFESNRTFFITIVPFNAAGDAIGCTQESFSTIAGCGPFFDPLSGELVSLNPEINFPDTVGICVSDAPTIISTDDIADGFRWFSIDENGNDILLSETDQVSISEIGEYRYEAFNNLEQSGSVVACSSTKSFTVTASEIAVITSLNITNEPNGVRITAEVNGIGDYEYALDNSNGPYQDSNVFRTIALGSHTVYVRDKNGCGIADATVEQDLTVEGFPKFFTPNGDGFNDFWQFIPPPNTMSFDLVDIFIFNRFGQLIVQIDPRSQGWDGTLNGRPLPAADYWFRAATNENQKIQGHFALKR